MTHSAFVVERSNDIQNLIGKIRQHALYRHVRDIRSLRVFMRSHVFAVWDFQSLLKSLQRSVTCVEVPWIPTSDAEARRFVNEMVLDEESDVCPWGAYLSHFEIYRIAMLKCDADTRPIDAFIQTLKHGGTVEEALAASGTSPGVKRFVRTTMEVAESGSAHRIAAAFSLGREDIIPQMFQQLVEHLAVDHPSRLATFKFYLERHIINDADHHGPMARKLLARLCGSDPLLEEEARMTALRCLEARIELWDEVLCQIGTA